MRQLRSGQVRVRGSHWVRIRKVLLEPDGWTGGAWSVWRHNPVLVDVKWRMRIKEAIVVVDAA